MKTSNTQSILSHALAVWILTILFGLNAQAQRVDMENGHLRHSPAVGNLQLQYTNKTGEAIFDFTFTIRTDIGGINPVPGPPCPNARITGASVTPQPNPYDFDVDDNLNGTLQAGENNDTVDPPNPPRTTAKIIARPGKQIPNNGQFTLNININPLPAGPFFISIQPTDKTSKAIGKPLDMAPFGSGCKSYGTLIDPEAATIAPYTGLVFNDVNNTGQPLNWIFLVNHDYQILNAYQKDANGNQIPSGNYDPINGCLQLNPPVLPGQQFFIGMQTDIMVPGFMQVTTCTTQPQPPTSDIVSVEMVQLDLKSIEPISIAGLSKELEWDISVTLPPSGSKKYLNAIVGTHTLFFPEDPYGQPIWAIQNVVIEPFASTQDLSIFIDPDPLGFLPDGDTIFMLDMYWYLTDTIITQIPVAEGPFEQLPVLPFEHDGFFDGPLPTHPSIVSLPQSSITSWINDILTPYRVFVGCDMTNYDADSTTYHPGSSSQPYAPSDYAGDKNACAPLATTNSFSWMRGEYPDLDSILRVHFGDGDSAKRKMLVEFSKLMDRANEEGVNITDFIEGKLAFIDKYKLPIRVTYQGTDTPDSINSPNKCYGHKAVNQSRSGASKISPKWIYDRMNEKSDLEIYMFGKKKVLGPNGVDSVIKTTWGHAVVLTGISYNILNNKWQLWYKDDEKQSGPGGTKQHAITLDSLGNGIWKIPELSNAKWGDCLLTDAVSEHYDPTITHRAIKGKAFKDDNGNGLYDPFEIPVPRLPIQLIDPAGGIFTTETDADGFYIFPDLGFGNHDVQFVLPQGWGVSLPGTGPDSLRSSLDPLGHIQIPFQPPVNDATHANGGFTVDSFFDIWYKLEGPFDPLTGLMGTQLPAQNLLPIQEPYTALGDTPTHTTPLLTLASSIYNNVVDWVFVQVHDPLDQSIILASKPGILMPDGHILEGDSTPFHFDDILFPDSIFISVWHRNHLGIRTLLPIDPLGILDRFGSLLPPVIDFTDPFTPPFGPDTRLILMTQALVLSGDADHSGTINATDRSQIQNSRNAVGYLPSDVNLDGVTNSNDKSKAWNNRNKQQQLD